MNRLLRRASALAAVFLLTTAVSFAAPLFPDLPETHWARDAVRALAEKGLVEGYPDGTFKGDRAASRWEVAMIIARLLAKMEQEHTRFATKAELEELRKIVNAYREELDALGVRVTNLEETTARLDKRVSELERIRFYGRLHFVGVSNNARGSALNIGSVGNPAIDWSTGRLITEGTGLSSVGVLGLNADISDDIVAGAEFVAFASQGDAVVDAYWGASAPFLANPWTAQGSLTPGVQPDNHAPFTRMVMDNFWLRHKPTDTRVTVGSFFNEYVSSFVINGARNPNIHRPRWLPFFGANVKGTIAGKDSGWKYEAFYTKLPELTTYETHALGGAIRYEFDDDRGFATVSFARTQNERIADGVLQGAGGPLIPLPAVPFTGPGAPPVPINTWLDNRPVVPVARAFVGPQDQNTWGIEFNYEVVQDPSIRVYGEWASSDYNPDKSQIFFNTSVSGDMFRFGVNAEPTDGLEIGLEYMTVDPTYDPFIAAYPVPPGIPVFLPYGNYYSNYYQLHDYLQYPNNREGFKFYGSYLFNEDRTRVFVNYESLNQKVASTPAQIQTVGNIEPLFPIIQTPFTSPEGDITSIGFGVGHRFDMGLTADFEYYNYNISRGAVPIDDVDLAEDIYRLNLEYPITDEWDVRASVYHLDYRGHSGILNTDFSQTIPGIGFDWNMARNATVSVDYRFMDLDNRAFPAASYNGGQLLVEMKLDF